MLKFEYFLDLECMEGKLQVVKLLRKQIDAFLTQGQSLYHQVSISCSKHKKITVIILRIIW